MTLYEYLRILELGSEATPEDDLTGNLIGICVTGFCTVLMVFFMIVCGSYFVIVERDMIRFGYRWWNVTTTIDQIESVQIDQARFSEFLGMGWRISLKNKRIGYIAAFGPAVEIKIKSGKTYLISCKDPEQCVQAMGFESAAPEQTET